MTPRIEAGISECQKVSILCLGLVLHAQHVLQCMFVLFFPDFCEGSDDSDSLNRSFTCRMKCTLNHGGGFYKVIIVPVVTCMLYI